MYDIRLDRARRFLHVTTSGFWDLPTLDRYDHALQNAMRELRSLGGTSRCLIDTRGYGVQSQEIGPRFMQHLAAIEPLWPDRVAQLVLSAIVKMQGQRAIAGWKTRPTFFTSEDEAMEWLFSDRAAAAA